MRFSETKLEITDNTKEILENFSVMAECDPESLYDLNQEINDLRNDNYPVEIISTEDKAYESPEKIKEIYNYLKVRDEILATEKDQAVAAGIGSLGLSLYERINPVTRAAKIDRGLYKKLDPVRIDILYGPNETNSIEWHNQRGRAAALSTIVEAHHLSTVEAGNTDGIYPTMSGPLDEKIFDYKFEHASDGFKGLDLKQAIIKSEMDYSGKDLKSATKKADRRIESFEDFVQAPTYQKFKDVVEYCSDSLGIRARKEVVNQNILNYIGDRQLQGDDPEDMLMMSFGCGTAQPILEGLAKTKAEFGAAPKLILLDQDPLSLAAAARMAEKMDLSDNIEVHCKRLFSRIGKPLNLDEFLKGRQLDIAEDSGLREYLPDHIYKGLTRETWKHLKDGGIMSTGNMNANRPQSEFLHGMMGWQPKVIMRQIKDSFRLHEQAGIPKGATKASVTQDGVYTLFTTIKS